MKTLSADMGGSRVKLATVENGTVIESEMFTVSSEGFTGTLAELERRVSAMRARHPGEWDGIGIALPGIIDEERGRVLSCNDKHAGVENVDIFAWAREKLSLPCRVINDARAALLGGAGLAGDKVDTVDIVLGVGVHDGGNGRVLVAQVGELNGTICLGRAVDAEAVGAGLGFVVVLLVIFVGGRSV